MLKAASRHRQHCSEQHDALVHLRSAACFCPESNLDLEDLSTVPVTTVPACPGEVLPLQEEVPQEVLVVGTPTCCAASQEHPEVPHQQFLMRLTWGKRGQPITPSHVVSARGDTCKRGPLSNQQWRERQTNDILLHTHLAPAAALTVDPTLHMLHKSTLCKVQFCRSGANN